MTQTRLTTDAFIVRGLGGTAATISAADLQGNDIVANVSITTPALTSTTANITTGNITTGNITTANTATISNAGNITTTGYLTAGSYITTSSYVSAGGNITTNTNFTAQGTGQINGNVGIGTAPGTDKLFVSGRVVSTSLSTISLSGDIWTPNGMYHHNDANTYISFPSNDTVAITTSGSQQFTVNNDGMIEKTTLSPASPSARQIRAITISDTEPDDMLDGVNGDIWFYYQP